MAIYGAFSPVTLGLLSQSHAINTIGTNIANVNTGGYKRTDTQFQTVLSRALFEQSDLGGVKPIDVQRIDVQGQLVATANDLDLAINGDGFFILSPTLTVGSELFYSRDGAFQVRVGTNASGAPTNEGYIADKNGFYLLGWVPNATTGAFPSSGAGGLQALRVDTAFFANSFQATTEVDIGLNLPSTNPIINAAQVDTVTLAGTIEPGDVYTVTINGTAFSYTTTGAEADINAVRNALITSINANGPLPVTAFAGNTGIITLSSDTPGTAYTLSSSATNGGAFNDNSATSANVIANFNHQSAVTAFQNGTTTAGFEHYEFFVIDSLGTRQTVRLNFTKSADNTWQVSATTQRTAVAQVDTVTLGGTIEAGDQYSVTISGTTFTHTATAADTLTTIRNALVTQINNNTTLPVTASASGTNAITLTADTAGSAFTSSASATNGGVTADNTATVANTTANVTNTVTTATSTISFNSKGEFTTTPTPLNFSISTFPGGGTATFTVDYSRFTQFGSGFLPTFIDTNGFAKSNLTGLHWETDGRLVGTFDNEFDRALYKIPVATFPSPNNLEAKNGMVFSETQASGTSTVTAVDATGGAEFAPGTVELSNVALEDQFTLMIQAQAVYNASATAFKTVDEMTVVARDLKA